MRSIGVARLALLATLAGLGCAGSSRKEDMQAGGANGASGAPSGSGGQSGTGIAGRAGAAADGGNAGSGGQQAMGCPGGSTSVQHQMPCSTGTACDGVDHGGGADHPVCDCIDGFWQCRWLTCPRVCTGDHGFACPQGELPDDCSCRTVPPQNSWVGGCCCERLSAGVDGGEEP
jgi:hypothetical protein